MSSKAMDNTKQRLPEIILKELYRNVLTDTGGGSPIPEKEADTPPATHTLGGNMKKILVIVHYPGSATIEETDLAFLMNILNACRLGLNDVRILNLAHASDKGYADIVKSHEPRTVLLFGVTPADIGMPVLFPENQVQRFADMRFLSAQALDRLRSDDAGKRQLWAALKQLFPN